MRRTLIVILAATICLLFTANGLATPPQDLCSKFKGAAYGVCKAAIAIGCDTEAKPECDQLYETFEQLTGETPFWGCPCGSSSDFIDKINADTNVVELSCIQYAGTASANYLTIEDTINVPGLIFSFYPNSSPKQTCGSHATSEYDLSNDEASSCIDSLLKVAKALNIECEKVSQ